MRVVVAAMHIALGGLVALEGLAVLLQARVNLVWESGFYGEVSTISAVVLGWSGLVIGLGMLTLGGGIRYWRDRSAGRWILVNSFALMLCAVPEPVAWILVAGSVLVVVEQYRHARALFRGDD